jgi:hypothetical protein
MSSIKMNRLYHKHDNLAVKGNASLPLNSRQLYYMALDCSRRFKRESHLQYGSVFALYGGHSLPKRGKGSQTVTNSSRNFFSSVGLKSF